MHKQQLSAAPVQVSTLGVHFMVPSDKTLYDKAIEELGNVQSRASDILADAEQQKSDIIASAKEAETQILAEARKRALDDSAAELIAYKAKLELEYNERLSAIQQGISTTLQSITQHLFSNSAKAEYIYSQLYEIAQTQLLDSADAKKTVIKGSSASLKAVSDLMRAREPALAEQLFFVDSSESTDKITIELGEKMLVINPAEFMAQLEQHFATEGTK